MIGCIRKRALVSVAAAVWRVKGLFAGVFVSLFLIVPTSPGQVVINEISAANSDRQLQRTQPGYPKLGTTTPWYLAGYDDSLWPEGKGPFGFGTFRGVTFGVNTSGLMKDKIPSLYVRKSFTASPAQAASQEQLQLIVRHNDGFIAFLNGNEVARLNMGNPGMFAYRDQTAFNTNSGSESIALSLGIASNLLVSGNNILCIQAHNKAITSTDSDTFLCQADLRLGITSSVSLVTNNAVWRYLVGAVEPSGGVIDYGLLNGVPVTATWATLGFNDSSWPEANGPFGIESAIPPDYILGTNLFSQVYNKASSIYSRALFSATASEAASTNALQLILDYDDGIIVYLNGREIARRNVGTTNTITPYNAVAQPSHNANGDNGGTTTNMQETVTLGAAKTLIAGGYNVLAVQLFNSATNGSDMIGRVTLATTGPNARVLAKPEDAACFFIGTSEPQRDGGEEEEDGGADVEEDTPDSEGDWIELFNRGAETANLTGWSLTDDAEKPRKWYFPANSSIPPGGYLVVMATGYDVGPSDGATYLHTNFKLSSDGEYLGLVNAAGQVVSEIAPAYPPQDPFHSYGRNLFGAYVYSDTASPGAANSGMLFSGIAQPPVFSHLGGFYSASFPLQLSSADPLATIRYTVDGTEPTELTGVAYSAPVTISSNTAFRARCFKAGKIPSKTVTQTYFINQSAARRSLAAISFTADPVLALYGPNASGGPTNGEGIMAIKGGGYTNYSSKIMWYNRGDMSAFNMPSLHGRCAERASGFEYYPTSGVPLRTDLGLRISSSGYSRPQLVLSDKPSARFTPGDPKQKPSFNIFFRSELGESPQDYPFFPDSKITKFEDIRIRAGKNDITNPFIRDELMRRIFIGTGQEGSRGLFTSIYINGVWKGYFNICEHLREAFMQQHHNSTAAWDVQQVSEFASGDAIHWNSTIAYLRTNNLATVTAYQGVDNFLDVDNVIDYLLVNIYAATSDWPQNNWVAAHERSDAGRWRFYMWDAEGGLGGFGRTTIHDIFIGDKNGDGVTDTGETYLNIGASAKTTYTKDIRVVYTLLVASPEFRLRFADRIQKHFFHAGCLTRASMEKIHYALCDQINPIMKETINQYVNQSFFTNWIQSSVRRDVVFGQFAKYGLWPATLAPEFSQHGGEIATNSWVSITNLNSVGSIYFTTNGVDPRALGGAVAGALYTSPLRFPATATLKARVLAGGEWSPLQEATFVVPLRIPYFLPPGNADWTVDANWSTDPLPYPNGIGAAALIGAPASANREANLRAPVTIGALTFNQDDTPYRNKISDSGSTNTLTFMSTNSNAALTVNGFGPGYVELEVDAGVILGTNLTISVNNPTGTVSYGALRLKENWSGPGGLTKEGVGLAAFTGDGGLTFTGPTVINRGVLQFEQPSSPVRSRAVTVNPGGQLRMTTPSTAGAPCVYDLGGDLTLNSLGRGGELPDVSGLGVSGALRYDPVSNDSVAIISNRIVFAGPSAIHVENARNALQLSGPLLGTYSFVKTGSGNLILPAMSKSYYVPVCVSNGTLTVHGRIISPVEVAANAQLSGTGMVGPVHGSGTVALDGTILSSPAAIGLNYAFSFTTGAPDYLHATGSGNSVLRLLSIRRGGAAPMIDVYLDLPAIAAGDCLRGGFFVECGDDLNDFLASAVMRFYEPSESGSQAFAGRLYAPYSGMLALAVTAMPETADFGDGPRQGYVMEIRAAGQPVSFSEWLQVNFPAPVNPSDPQITAPFATPYGGPLPNLFRYALNIGINEPVADKLPRLALLHGNPIYTFRFDPGKRDIVYRVEASSAVTGDWTRVLFDSRTADPAQWNWDGQSILLFDEASGPALFPAQYYRLRIQLAEP